ncbi:MAG TPA: peptidase E [Anaerolineae bacterium]|nr:peptidase E [Anaerolineae bacterium]
MATTPHIVALGGGDMRTNTTLAIDQYIINQTGKERPNALFIPTATDDSSDYVDLFNDIYGQQLNCQTNTLYLYQKPDPPERRAQLIAEADLIYVGGGNTLKMMKTWRRLGVDKLLRQAAAQGTILSGISAGAICWFKYGHSDSASFTAEDDNWAHMRVTALGLIPLLYCPHYHSEQREDSLAHMIATRGGRAIACDDDTAIIIKGDQYRIITSQPHGRAYHLRRQNYQAVRTQLLPTADFAPLADLL